MRGDAPSAETPGVELDQQLLDAKLSAPEPPAQGYVSRAPQIEAARSSGRRFVGVTAPAGYGKSSLLAEWTRSERRPVAWVSLDRYDDDPAALLTLLAAAVARIQAGRARGPLPVTGHGVALLGREAPLLAAALRRAPAPFVLVLDDLQELRDPACRDVLSVVFAGIPAGSQLVVASRGEPWHIARARAEGDAFEITADELALDAVGVQAIFANTQVPLSADDALELVERTEGWPVGVVLAAAIAGDGDRPPATVSGDDRYVADYLYRESLVNLPEHHQRFLRRTSVLDTLSAPLCDAILGTHDAQLVLAELDASNVFIVPLDRSRGWYRYHALYREFLLGELRRLESQAVPELQSRAASWFEAQGSTAMAIELLLDQPAERARTARLVAATALPSYQSGQLATVQRWMREIGDPAIEAYPPLAVLAGWVMALSGQSTEAARWASMLENISYDGVPDDGSASFDSARAMLRSAMCAAGPEQALADAELACAAEPSWSPWRDQALQLLGEARLLVGDVPGAVTALSEGAAIASATGNAEGLVACAAELALLSMDDGRWDEAEAHVTASLEAIDERHMYDYATAVLAFTQAARLALHHGDLAAVRRELTRAMRARPACTEALPYLAVRARLQLAKVYWAVADHATAHHLLREIDDILLRRPGLGALTRQVEEFRRLVTMSEQQGDGGGPPLTPAELRLLPYLQTHLSVREIGERLFVSRNTVSSELGSIYRKLGVSARSDAVERATQLGLLGSGL
ncbi:LuxR family transcriptional regulator [Agromyces sp. Root1464]|uniref:LuxR C-terminal-related transcriptional regulator n=1 Tax=Agromyces sp. Root1464 TaxID=1736467 RepID=UPI0006FF761E|nr:LuxR C-terminal-related transcriptional regulator [Agromyces sp. Root1464]KQZ07574.1 LuxR family transcriptional regulator [Agromyces sp. Root1464]